MSKFLQVLCFAYIPCSVSPFGRHAEVPTNSSMLLDLAIFQRTSQIMIKNHSTLLHLLCQMGFIWCLRRFSVCPPDSTTATTKSMVLLANDFSAFASVILRFSAIKQGFVNFKLTAVAGIKSSCLSLARFSPGNFEFESFASWIMALTIKISSLFLLWKHFWWTCR